MKERGRRLACRLVAAAAAVLMVPSACLAADDVSSSLRAYPAETWPREAVAERWPGEGVRIIACVKVESRAPLILPVRGVRLGLLHVKTPDGRRFVQGNMELGDRLGQTVRPGPGPGPVAAEFYVDFVDRPSEWRADDGEAAGPTPSFRAPGRYELWYEAVGPAGWRKVDAPPEEGAAPWVGRAKSPVITVTVRALTRDDVRAEPTPEQLADLRAVWEGAWRADDAAAREIEARLAGALASAPNDGLARAAVELLAKEKAEKAQTRLRDPNPWRHIEYLVFKRAMRGGRIGIDTSYLRPFVELELDVLDDWFRLPPTPGNVPPTPWGAHPLLAEYVHTHDADDLRRAAAALAMKNARLSDVPADVGLGAPTVLQYHWDRLSLAWSMLASFDALRGMSREEVAGILGRPTGGAGDVAEWYFSSPMHVNPGLRIHFTDGKADRAESFR